MPHPGVTGRQIRWGSVGRVAAIAAAVIAGIVSLPALLGGDAPPPVPPDVGLTPPPLATTPTRIDPDAVPAPAPPRSEKHRHRVHEPHRVAHRRPRQHHRHPRPHGDPDEASTIQVPSTVYAPAPVYSAPRLPGEFQIEP